MFRGPDLGLNLCAFLDPELHISADHGCRPYTKLCTQKLDSSINSSILYNLIFYLVTCVYVAESSGWSQSRVRTRPSSPCSGQRPSQASPSTGSSSRWAGSTADNWRLLCCKVDPFFFVQLRMIRWSALKVKNIGAWRHFFKICFNVNLSFISNLC